ncbi:MAG: hypothetical protein R2834_12035 [Rhodothermales bacterium]
MMPPHSSQVDTRLSWRHHVRRGVVLLVLLTSAGELVARYGLGLGDPPLSVADPRIEYRFKPDQDLYRFHHHFATNAYGMRSDPIQNPKGRNELRILFFGDSVVNGGSLIDQSELATTLVQDRLAGQSGIDVTVGNVSAGSWGPGNWLAWAETYGFFDADVIVLVISSHDARDNPTFAPLDPSTHPTEKPVLALYEALTRYVPRYLPGLAKPAPALATPGTGSTSPDAAMQHALTDLERFLLLASAQTRAVLVIQHLEIQELDQPGPTEGFAHIDALCRKLGIATFDLRDPLTAALKAGGHPYSDNIHLTREGQRLLADAVLRYWPDLHANAGVRD